MRTGDMNRCTIRRIRLVNFHNFVDETIDVCRGGHLFLLGDNASGKTTILDAVHYVLTAGEGLEFNAAARVAGSREGGRRIQGAILRYNVDTGPLNPDGAISYAALEIADARGVPTTVAIGMTAASMDDKVQRWGIVRECPLGTIPFLLDTPGGGRRPCTRQEMQAFFGEASGFHGNIATYQREVAGRFFGGGDTFREACRLLSMGKAYREIVAHTSDYHQLFRDLLPEPRTDMFEQVITALRSLDQSAADLKGLEEKRQYLDGVRGQVARIDAAREERIRLTWLLHRHQCHEQQSRRDDSLKSLAEREARLADLRQRTADCQREQVEQQKRIADLQQKDTSGIIRQEKEVAAECERRVKARADAAAAATESGRKLKHEERASVRQREALRQSAVSLFAACSRMMPNLPFPLTELTAALDAVQREATPEQQVDAVPFQACRELALTHLRHPAEQSAVLDYLRQAAQQQVDDLRPRLQRLRQEDEAVPAVAGFAEALTALRQALIDATPLYAGLEWAPGLGRDDAAAYEELIGDEVLGTIMVRDADFAAAREIVFRTAPGLRVARAPAFGDLEDWMHAAFDIARSDACVLRCLAEELSAHCPPEFESLPAGRALRFRSHERRLAASPARLVGLQTRQEARRLELRRVEEELAAQEKEVADLVRRQSEFRSAGERIEEFRHRLDEGGEQLRRLAGDTHAAAARLAAAAAEHRNRQERLAEIGLEVKALEERRADLREVISREGLDRLEEHIARAGRRLDRLRESENALHAEWGSIENQRRGIVESIARLDLAMQESGQRMQAEETALRARGCTALDLAAYVLGTCGGSRYQDRAAVEAAFERVSHQEGETVGGLHAALLHPVFGAQFGFAYDPEANRLTDRRGVDVADLAELQRQRIEEQAEVINQKTRELFRRLIVDQLLQFLYGYVRDLRDMVKRINRLLAERSFGQYRYRFQLQEVERYRRLIDIVERFNPFQAEQAAEEVRLFFEDHHDDILGTEVNAIPDVLDYRNWFHYDMRLQAAGSEDGVLMDRRTKSIGSGGEQAVPNYLLILTIADFLFRGNAIRLQTLLFDEAFYGIDANRRDQILGFATDIGLQLLVASPDQDGVRREVAYSTSLLVVKDAHYDVHLFPCHWENPDANPQPELLAEFRREPAPVRFGAEL